MPYHSSPCSWLMIVRGVLTFCVILYLVSVNVSTLGKSCFFHERIQVKTTLFLKSYPMYTWALHRRLSNETVHNPDSLPSKSLPKPAAKSRGGDVRRLPP